MAEWLFWLWPSQGPVHTAAPGMALVAIPFFFLAALLSLQDLSSPTGIEPRPRQQKCRVLTTELPGDSWALFL